MEEASIHFPISSHNIEVVYVYNNMEPRQVLLPVIRMYNG